MLKLLYVGLGGAAGACLRYVVTQGMAKTFGAGFPYGTLIVNVAGGLLIGLLMGLSVKTNVISPELRLLLTTGVLGGLTTFSTFSYETVTLFENGSYLLGAGNICLNVVLSLIGVVIGKFAVALFV